MRYFAILACSLLLICRAFGATDDSAAPPAEPAAATTHQSWEDQGRVGFAVKGSLLGVGAEVATRVTHRTNARAGFNVFGYSRTFDKDGISYGGHLSFRTIEAHYDIFPWAGSFHISPGLLAYIGNPITASAVVPGNSQFTLGGVSYYSDPNKPLSASGRINFNQVSPMLTVGFGNLVHRDSKRFSVPFEIGVAFQGSPKSTLNLGGNVCDAVGVNCRAALDPIVQSNMVAEQTKINNSMSFFKVYPIISVGFGYKF